MREIINYYLEMQSSEQLCECEKEQPEELNIIEAKEKEYRFNRYLYQLVGAKWRWTDRLALSDEQWQSYAENQDVKTFVVYFRGGIAGYYELQQHSGGDVQLVYFGLVPKFIGRGFGGYMLTHALKTAWSLEGTERVWLNTCNHDHPNAMANYQARGLRIFKVERKS